MATVAGQGTTYTLPNYHGELFEVTPTETPFLSAIGGLGGAKTTTATQFEWQTVDRRSSSANNVALEGAAAPSGAERARSNVDNVVEIHHSAIEVSYSKLAAKGNFSGANIAPQQDDLILDELAVQTMAELESMAVDIEKSFLTGVYQKPTDNTTPRKTRGILTAISTNSVSAGKSLGTAATATSGNTVTLDATPTTAPAVGDQLTFGSVGASGLVAGQTYYVLTYATKVMTVSATQGGTAAVIAADATGVTVATTAAIGKDAIEATLKSAFDNGAKLPQASTVFLCGSAQKVALSAAYATPTLNQVTRDRTVGGVNIETLVTPFGTFGVMLDRWAPANQVAVLDLSVCYPVFLEIPGKGLLFTEEIARTGAARKFQLYGEIGLEYGPETFHALLTDLAV